MKIHQPTRRIGQIRSFIGETLVFVGLYTNKRPMRHLRNT